MADTTDKVEEFIRSMNDIIGGCFSCKKQATSVEVKQVHNVWYDFIYCKHKSFIDIKRSRI